MVTQQGKWKSIARGRTEKRKTPKGKTAEGTVSQNTNSPVAKITGTQIIKVPKIEVKKRQKEIIEKGIEAEITWTVKDRGSKEKVIIGKGGLGALKQNPGANH